MSSWPDGPVPPPPMLFEPGAPAQDAGAKPARVRRARRALAYSALVVLVAGAGVGGYAWWQAQSILDEFHAGDKAAVVEQARLALGTAPPAEIGLPAPAETHEVTNALLIGSDTRSGTGGNSDTMILARLDDVDGTISLLSIPRDLKVDIPGHGADKINAAYSLGGARLAIETVRNTFGVRVDRFAVVDFAGFRDAVDAAGGVYLPVDQRYYNRNDGSSENNYADIDLQPGYQLLDGADALSFARYRHGDSDYFRQARQQLFLSEAKRVLERKISPSSPRTAQATLRALARSTTSDVSSLSEMMDLIGAVRGVSAEGVHRFTIPGKGWIESDGRYYLHADDGEVEEIVAAWRDPGSPSATHVPQPDTAGFGSSGTTTRDTPDQSSDASVDDGGQGAAIVAGHAPEGLSTCTPTRMPAGSSYPSGGARGYELAGAPALAISVAMGPGRHALWMMSGWQDPPILERPSTKKVISGRELSIYRRAGRPFMVAFTHEGTRVWITNTLRDELSESTLIDMALSCR